MSEPFPNQAPPSVFLSSNVVQDFEKVEVVVGLHCPCNRQLKPHDFVERQGRIEAICGGCHSLLLSIEPVAFEEEDDDEDAEDDE
jgi:hypothetical protein